MRRGRSAEAGAKIPVEPRDPPPKFEGDGAGGGPAKERLPMALSMPERLNADFAQPAALALDEADWIASPQPGVLRKPLDRVGVEVARATSVVRYEGGRSFPHHAHGLGEEFLVLAGVFSDESGDFGPGAYVRNPPRQQPRALQPRGLRDLREIAADAGGGRAADRARHRLGPLAARGPGL